MPLEPVRKTSASNECFEQLVAELVSGEMGPGDPLPAERSLSVTFGVNRQAIREALQRLAQAGLVRISQGEPTRALDYRMTATLDLLPRLLIRPDGLPEPEAVRSVMEMRLSIGTDAARLAAERATPAHIDRLRNYIAATGSETDLAAVAEADLSLWDAIVDAADNIAYRLAFNSLRDAYKPLLEQIAPVLETEIADIESHTGLIEAIAARDPQSAAALAHRLLSAGASRVALFLSEMEGEKS